MEYLLLFEIFADFVFTCATTTPTRQILWKNLCRATRTRTQTDEVGAHSAAITLSLCRGFFVDGGEVWFRSTPRRTNFTDPLLKPSAFLLRCFCEGDHGNAPCYPGSKPGILLLDSSPIFLCSGNWVRTSLIRLTAGGARQEYYPRAKKTNLWSG